MDADETGQTDLRGGTTPWAADRQSLFRPIDDNLRCDALIVGAGITGALMAERLTRQGLDVVIVDRERPGRGSTAASTAMLLWEIDRSLGELTDLYGFERARRAYRASYDAATGLQEIVSTFGIACDLRPKSSLYLAAGDSATSLRDEHALRGRAGLPGDFCDHRELMHAFEIARTGALVSPGSADVDPVRLTDGLLRLATSRGARLISAEATTFDPSSASVCVGLDDGHECQARVAVLATGYVMPDIVTTTIQTTQSSWAIATTPQPERLWRGGALIWEDSDDYLYARTTADGRIIIGGEDEEIFDPGKRDVLIAGKAKILQRKLAALWPRAALDLTCAWSGVFDTTRDGLPLIGPVPGANNIYAAYGYGGNGITFSFMAAQLIGDLIAGQSSPLLNDFAIERD